MGSSSSSHVKYNATNPSPSSSKSSLKSGGRGSSRTKNVGGRKISTQKRCSSNDEPSDGSFLFHTGDRSCSYNTGPGGLVESCVSHHSDDVHHPDFDFSERITDHHDDHEFDIQEVTSKDHVGLLGRTAADLVESFEEDDDSTTDDDHDDENLSTVVVITENEMDDDEDDYVDEEDDDDDDEDDEVNEFWLERMRILEDARMLKAAAIQYYHPEQPIGRTYSARCYFDRISAPTSLSFEEANEVGMILHDAKVLKGLASDYLHPEKPIVANDPTVFGRNYYDRYSGIEQESAEEMDEATRILMDAKSLKQYAKDYAHPEVPVQTTDPTLFGRNYFNRPSADDVTDNDMVKERDTILADAVSLKKLAVDYLHPEISVVNADPTTFGRNYYSRSSAPQCDEEEERLRILQDAKALRQCAAQYLHPEVPVVTTDGGKAYGRNYFTRYSAPEQVDCNDPIECIRILHDMKQMRQLAVDYLHPEIPVVTTDPTACGRNYYSRYTSPEMVVESLADTKYREQVIRDVKAFKQLAVDFLHPEVPVVSTKDPTCYGRNFYHRLSAPDTSLVNDMVRNEVMNDMKLLKEMAMQYLHPEIPVQVHSTSFARCFFDTNTTEEEKMDYDERDRILQDMKMMKQLAMDYLHPEIPVAKTVDPYATGRNFFHRYTAPEQESEEDDEQEEERERILQDMKMLKKLATDYLHPELRVQTTDPTVCGRNFFNRYNAPEPESDDDEQEERERILQDMKMMKKLATDYLHPELQVQASDPCATGRNFFHRYNAPDPESEEDDEDEQEERERILQDMKMLKQFATDYLHPELRVQASDPTVCGRNFFHRYHAPEQESEDYKEQEEERERILQDMKMMKKFATDYLHPELRVQGSDPTSCGRNFFHRYNAPEPECEDDDDEQEEERERILQDMKMLKKFAIDYLHPERRVQATDPTACGRNYYDRPSSYLHNFMIQSFPGMMHEDEHYDDDDSHHGGHMDHFGMDLDHYGMDDEVAMYGDMHQNFDAISTNVPFYNSDMAGIVKEEGGNLSRSPSSIMLFCEDPNN